MIFCRHKWKILSDKMTESKIAHLRDLGLSRLDGGSNDSLERMSRRKIIQVFSCDKCGQLKALTTEI